MFCFLWIAIDSREESEREEIVLYCILKCFLNVLYFIYIYIIVILLAIYVFIYIANIVLDSRE